MALDLTPMPSGEVVSHLALHSAFGSSDAGHTQELAVLDSVRVSGFQFHDNAVAIQNYPNWFCGGGNTPLTYGADVSCPQADLRSAQVA